jgi:ketosteroid isomerase-like protein
MNGMGSGRAGLIGRLLEAVNGHDLDGIGACFADDYVNETPAHPQRGFQGREQVRRNWTQILAGVPDLQAHVPRSAVTGFTAWTEWEMSGTRADGAGFLMRGVVIFTIPQDTITSARFYLEPVEESSGDVDAATRRVVGDTSEQQERQTS